MASLRERKYGIQGKTMQSNKNAQHQIQLARICGHEKCISDNDRRASKITKDHCGTDIFKFFIGGSSGHSFVPSSKTLVQFGQRRLPEPS